MTAVAGSEQARAATKAALDRMPLLCSLVDNLRSSGFSFPPHAMVFGVQHLMAQSLGLCWALDALGLAYDRIALAGKAYSTCPTSALYLKALGVMVSADRRYDMRRSQSEELVEDVRELARRFDVRRSDVLNPSVLILDDGGQALTRLQSILPTPILTAGVEQTASGFWQTGIRSVPMPIVDVGASAVKRLCEPAIIVEAALSRARARLAKYPHDITVGIVGLGFIGASLAKALAAEGYSLRIYDRRPGAYHKLHNARCDDVRELIDQSDVVFGCTGIDVTRNLIEDISARGLSQRNREFLSVSSGDDEFFTLKTALLPTAENTEYRIDHIPDVVGEIAGSTFRIARNAFPINFDNGIESVPLEWIQGTICALVAALAQAQLIRRPAVRSHLTKRITLDIDFQEWLLRQWKRELPVVKKFKNQSFSLIPRRTVLQRLSKIRTNLESEVVPPVFDTWTAQN